MMRPSLTRSFWPILALVVTACGGDATNSTNDEGTQDRDQQREINRQAVEDSPFKPAAMEESINDLIEELSAAEAPEETLEVTVVTKPFGGYWEPVKVGANRAMAELEINGQVEAPADDANPDITTERQIEILRKRREEGYGGIAVAPMRDTLAEEMDASVDEGIPVVTLDSDLPTTKRQLYIGTNNAEAGKTAGQTLVDLLEEGEGTVIVLGYDAPDWPDGYARSKEAHDVLADAGFTPIIHRIGWTEEEIELDFEVLPSLIADADPPSVGIVGMFSNAYRGAQIAEQLEYDAGALKIVAFDFEPDTLDYMERGYIQATHAQRQYYMGYLVPYAIYSIQVLGVERTTDILSAHMIDDSRFDTGVDVVLADQVEDYNNFLDSLGIGG